MSRKVKMENVVRIFQQTILFFLHETRIFERKQQRKKRKRERERAQEPRESLCLNDDEKLS